MRWDPGRYGQYADERSHPFLDLIARVGASSPRQVVDMGCGPGTLTALLSARWPSASVEGIDSSPEMIEAAAPGADPDARLSFRVGDASTFELSPDVDVLVSNAVLQWVPDHRALLSRWAAALGSGAWLAIQVPGNFAAPAHRLMRELAESPRWATSLGDVLRHHDAVASPAEYLTLLLDAGLSADVWETTYLHLLPGKDPVLDWVRGTGLRPVLAALSAEDGAEFEESYAALLTAAYPPGPHGTVFPFRRVFLVGHRL